MNIEANKNVTVTTLSSKTTSSQKAEEGVKFADELANISNEKNTEEAAEKPVDKTENITKAESETEQEIQPEIDLEPDTETKESEENNLSEKTTNDENVETEAEPDIKLNQEDKPKDNPDEENPIKNVIEGLQDVVEKINSSKTNPSKTVNCIEEKSEDKIKNKESFTDNKDKVINIVFEDKNDTEKEDNNLINNDMNITDIQDKFTPQMNSNMNFNSNNQPFSEFVNPKQENELKVSDIELAEEAAILSTMEENIAIANKNRILPQKDEPVKTSALVKPETRIDTAQETASQEVKSETKPEIKTIINETGIKKVDTKSNITVETVVKYDTVIVDKSDVEFFTNLVENGTVDINTKAAEKSSQVSKTLADLIAKSMNENKPVRIDFDNEISVIIKIGKGGKISADFLPSSQIAEAYLKENLPLLKQKFDSNNIDYDELNQRKQQRQDDKDNRKKGRKDE